MEKKMLIIDDDPAFREMVGIAMRRAFPGIYIDEARDGHLAERKLKGETFDVILLDYKLPFGMDGIRFLEKTREIRAGTPLIMITGEGNEEVAAMAFRLGVTDYLVKRKSLLYNLEALVKDILEKPTEENTSEHEPPQRKCANLNNAVSSVEFVKNYQEQIPAQTKDNGQMGEAVMIEFDNVEEFNKFSSFVKRIDGVKIQDVRILGDRFVYMLSLLPSRFEKMGKVFITE